MSISSGLIAFDDAEGLRRYIQMANHYPLLTQEEEVELVSRWIGSRDKEAAKKLVVTHIRLVLKIAMQYKSYGLALVDMVSEGVVGLVKAVKRFDPSKGTRFSTYAKWWVKAYIQSFVISSWSLVKVGTTSAQRKLFFNLRSLKHKILRHSGSDGFVTPKDISAIAKQFSVSDKDVIEMNERLSGQDVSLNAMIGSGDHGSRELQDIVPLDIENQEDAMIAKQGSENRVRLVNDALNSLSDREREIIVMRKLRDEPETLESLGERYGVSTERVRQIQVAALAKIRKFCAAAGTVRL